MFLGLARACGGMPGGAELATYSPDVNPRRAGRDK
jgi:hypothetical protein